MKKALIFALIFAFSASIAHAQVSSTDLTATATTGTPVQQTPEIPLTLTQKKVKAETDLRTLESQFRLFVSRTQLTIDRLTTKGVDTTKAQAELTAALTALNTTKANLDLFTTIVISDDMDEKAVEKSGLKPALVSIQESLKIARTHLIQSLAELKTSVTLTISQ